MQVSHNEMSCDCNAYLSIRLRYCIGQVRTFIVFVQVPIKVTGKYLRTNSNRKRK